jgi:hypothetical protein
MSVQDQLMQLMQVIADEASHNPRFSAKLSTVLHHDVGSRSSPPEAKDARTAISPARRGRRSPAVLDPVAIYAEGEDILRARLRQLDLEQLRDVVAEHGMNPDKLALKWKSSDRIIERVIEMSRSRATKVTRFGRESGLASISLPKPHLR